MPSSLEPIPPPAAQSREVRIRHLTVKGYRLRVAVWPGDEAGVPLLMMNGIGGRIELLAPLADAMPGIEIISFEVPGAGDSAIPRHPYTLAMLSILTGSILTRLGYSRVDVLGVSWGGTIAQEFARQNPIRCRRLVLAATLPGLPMVPGSPKTLLRLSTTRRFNDPEYRQRIAGELYGGAARTQPDLVEGLDKRMGGASKLGYLLQLVAISIWPGHLWLSLLRQPTLILAGDDDPIIPLVNARWMARQIPHSRLEVIHDGHLFFLSDPENIGKMIREFLDEATTP